MNRQGQYNSLLMMMTVMMMTMIPRQVLMQLPKKEEEVKYCPLLPSQQELYNSLLQKFSQEVEGAPGGGIAMFMQLRKAANHPLLIRSHYDDRRLLQMANALAKVARAFHPACFQCAHFPSHRLYTTHSHFSHTHTLPVT